MIFQYGLEPVLIRRISIGFEAILEKDQVNNSEKTPAKLTSKHVMIRFSFTLDFFKKRKTDK